MGGAHAERAVRREYFRINFTQLIIKPEINIRYDYGDIESLAQALLAGSEADPKKAVEDVLVGKKIAGTDKYEISDGFRRYYAMELIYKRTGKDLVCSLKPEPADWTDKERVLAMFLLNDNKPLEPLEMAYGIQRLLKCNMTQAQIAKQLGKTEAYISQLKKLLDAPEAAIILIKNKRVAAKTVIEQMVKGTIDKFIGDVKEGKYNKSGEEKEEEYFEHEVDNAGKKSGYSKERHEKKKKITGKQAAGSDYSAYKELKKVISTKDLKVHPSKKVAFLFMSQIITNDIKPKQILEYFTQK